MKNISKFNNMLELINILTSLRREKVYMPAALLPIEPVQVGCKYGFVNWHRYKLEYLPIFDRIDRVFTISNSCICVCKGKRWGVVNDSLIQVLPIAYNYFEANHVCSIINAEQIHRPNNYAN